jgi:hypothetical protein
MEFDMQAFVSTVGLPGALCFYVMVVLKKSVDANTKALMILAAKLGVNIDDLEGGK